jgi:ribosomal protein S27AE
MSIDELCALPVETLAEKDCLLFLWATFPQLPEALRLIKAWGFSFKTVAFVWLKLNRKSPTWFYGLGYWTRGNAEICLLAKRGHPKRYSKSVHQFIISPVEEHSKKPDITAQWETELTAIAKGQADPEGFMAGIAEMTRGLIVGYSQISEDAQKLFQTERMVIGKCPRCGESVYEGKKNYYCGNRSCQFVMWKNDRFFEERGKAFTPKIAAALLKDGKAKVKGLRSMKTGKTYDGTVLLADTGGKYVNYRVEQRDKN